MLNNMKSFKYVLATSALTMVLASTAFPTFAGDDDPKTGSTAGSTELVLTPTTPSGTDTPSTPGIDPTTGFTSEPQTSWGLQEVKLDEDDEDNNNNGLLPGFNLSSPSTPNSSAFTSEEKPGFSPSPITKPSFVDTTTGASEKGVPTPLPPSSAASSSTSTSEKAGFSPSPITKPSFVDTTTGASEKGVPIPPPAPTDPLAKATVELITDATPSAGDASTTGEGTNPIKPAVESTGTTTAGAGDTTPAHTCDHPDHKEKPVAEAKGKKEKKPADTAKPKAAAKKAAAVGEEAGAVGEKAATGKKPAPSITKAGATKPAFPVVGDDPEDSDDEEDIIDLPGFSETLSPGGQEAFRVFNKVENTGDAKKFVEEIAPEIDKLISKEKAQQIFGQYGTLPNNHQIVHNVQNIGKDAILARATTQNAGSIAGMPTTNMITMPAGDEQKYARFGAWGSPFYAHLTQKSSGTLNGYQAKVWGGTIGYDTMANDTMTVGLGLTYAQTKANHKDNLVGDRSKIQTYMLSIYGTQLINDDFFVTGVASFGSNNVKHTSPRPSITEIDDPANPGTLIPGLGSETAKSTYDLMSFGAELLLGYHIKANETLVVIPTLGASYNQFGDVNYTEKDTTFQNKIVTIKQMHKIEAVAGLKLVQGVETNGIAFTPELHGYARYAFSDKSPKGSARLSGMVEPITPVVGKAARFSGNVGTSVTMQSGVMDYSLGYDFYFAKKYHGHQGTLKVRVNF